MATKKKVAEEIKVVNKIVLAWVDEDGQTHEYIKRLKRPKGRFARIMLPRVLKFVSQLAEHESKLDDTTDIFSQMELIEQFFTAENEELFPFVLQLDTDEEKRILEEELSPGETLRAVSEAAGYIISESFSRPEVEAALKKSDGEELKEVE